MRNAIKTLSMVVAVAGVCACGNLVYKPAQLTDQGRGVVLVMHTAIGGECHWVTDVEARNIHGDPKYMRNKLRNDTAKRGGNVVKVDNWAPRAYASGRGFACPEEVARKLAIAEPATGDEAPVLGATAATEGAAPGAAAQADAGTGAQAPVADAGVAAPQTAPAPVSASDLPQDELPPPPPPPDV